VAGGHVPDSLLVHDGKDGVRFHGYVDDLSAFLAELWAFVVPLRYGGGLRIRLVEGLTAGTAVVATPVAVAGLGLEAGRHYLEGADEAGLASALIRVLGDELLRERLIRAGREFARERYGAASVRDRTVRLFRELAGESAA
jgi:glycosyltransferase involved in cell wall biosynthesis